MTPNYRSEGKDMPEGQKLFCSACTSTFQPQKKKRVFKMQTICNKSRPYSLNIFPQSNQQYPPITILNNYSLGELASASRTRLLAWLFRTMLLPWGVLMFLRAAKESSKLAVGSRLVGRLGSLALMELVGEPRVVSSVPDTFLASLLAALSRESLAFCRFWTCSW